jgi:hypothetical protein
MRVGVRWPGHSAMGCHGPLASGSCHFSDFFKIFHLLNLKFKIVTFPMSKIHRLLHRDSWKHRKQISFLEQLQIPLEFQVTISRTNSKLKLPWILKGFKHFWKKSNKFYKIPCPHPILYYKFTLTHLYSNIGSFFTSRNRYLVYFILNRAGHLRVLPPLSQVYHWSKMDKECSQVSHKHCTSIWETSVV